MADRKVKTFTKPTHTIWRWLVNEVETHGPVAVAKRIGVSGSTVGMLVKRADGHPPGMFPSTLGKIISAYERSGKRAPEPAPPESSAGLLAALGAVSEALRPLDQPSRRRVLAAVESLLEIER